MCSRFFRIQSNSQLRDPFKSIVAIIPIVFRLSYCVIHNNSEQVLKNEYQTSFKIAQTSFSFTQYHFRPQIQISQISFTNYHPLNHNHHTPQRSPAEPTMDFGIACVIGMLIAYLLIGFELSAKGHEAAMDELRFDCASKLNTYRSMTAAKLDSYKNELATSKADCVSPDKPHGHLAALTAMSLAHQAQQATRAAAAIERYAKLVETRDAQLKTCGNLLKLYKNQMVEFAQELDVEAREKEVVEEALRERIERVEKSYAETCREKERCERDVEFHECVDRKLWRSRTNMSWLGVDWDECL